MSDEIRSLIEQVKAQSDFFKKAHILEVLKIEKKVRIKDLSSLLELQPAYICHILRLNKLPHIIIDGYYAKHVSVTHLFIIARLNTQDEMSRVYEEVLAKSLTVSQTEELVRESLHGIASDGERIPLYEIQEFVTRLRSLRSEVSAKVIQTRVRGKIILEMKGGLKQTTPIIRSLLKKLLSQ